MKIEIQDSSIREELFGRMRDFWKHGRFCDVTLQSREGREFQAHRIVLLAASEPFTALFGGHFSEGCQAAIGRPVELDVSESVLHAVLEFIYCGTTSLDAECALEAIKFSHAYCLLSLMSSLARNLETQLRKKQTSKTRPSSLPITILVECACFGLHRLEETCERSIVANFEQYSEDVALTKLSAAQLGRIVASADLGLSREEVAYQAVLRWYWASPAERSGTLGLLFQHVDFASCSLQALRAADKLAQSMGPPGFDLQRAVRTGLRAHESGLWEKRRRRLPHWFPALGASMLDRVVVAGGNGQATARNQIYGTSSMAWHHDALIIADAANHRLVRWQVGDIEGEIIAGLGVSGSSRPDAIHTYSTHLFMESVAVASDGEIIWWQISECVWKIDLRSNSVEEMKWQGCKLEDIRYIQCSRSGLFILDCRGTRIVKIEGNEAQLVAGGNDEGPELNHLNQFDAYCFAVGDDETLYISDYSNDRILRWSPGGDRGEVLVDGQKLGQCRRSFRRPMGLCYTEHEQLYICEGGTKVIMWELGAHTCSCVVEGYATVGVLFAGGALYVSTRTDGVIRFGGPTKTLQL